MLITRVELENIKSYETGSFEFGPGITAISGPNGAGKTTILEAIAWALFDHLPYKKEDFLKRGTKKGTARVSFVSAVDGREYTVVRDTGNGYYIYDPVTKLKLVEQKGQVGGWIKQHLGIEPTSDLKTLFTTTIGVPQGTFTVDFADQPARRKIGFDKVLRVDEYQRSSEELRSLVKLVESRIVDLREEIARAEGELTSLDGFLAERDRYDAIVQQVQGQLASAEQAREVTRQDLARLDSLQKQIEKLSTEVAALKSRVEEGERRRQALAEEVRLSRAARKAMEGAAQGFAVYNEAAAILKELEPKAVTRDALKKELADKERDSYRLEASIQALLEKARQLDSDRQELDRLMPLVDEQESLEARRKELQASEVELAGLKAIADAGDRELKALRTEYADLSRQIDEAEKHRPMADRAVILEAGRRAAESELREMQVALERLGERKKEFKRIRENIAKLSAEVKTLELEMAGGLAAEELARLLPQLEVEDQRSLEEITRLKAGIEREQKILAGIKGGLCPLLAEPCRNMNEGQTLDQFFKIQIGGDREHLTALERARKGLQTRLAEARAAVRLASSLSTQRVQLNRYMEDLEIERATAARLEKEITESTVTADLLRRMTERLAKLEGELQEAQAARSKLEGLELFRARLERLKEEGTGRKKALAEIQDRIDAMSGLGGELARVDERLKALDDPRGRARSLRGSLEKEREVRETLASLEERARDAALALQTLASNLQEYAGLDEQVTLQRERRAAHEKEHRVYIESQPIAELLNQREAGLALLEQELEVAASRLGDLHASLEEASSQYDAGEHEASRKRLEELINSVAALTSELTSCVSRVAEIGREIERLMELRKRAARLGIERERFGQLLDISEMIREMLKRAAPFITEAHLQSISMEANYLFREITGNPMVSLRWDTGYEIVLEEDGFERPFATLSGGEQMAAALSVRLALLKELSDMRIAFFDEPTTNMDEDRRRNLAQQIGRIKDFDQLFVISHDDAFEGFTDQVVSVAGQAERG